MGVLKARIFMLRHEDYTPRQAAEYLGTSLWTIYKYAQRFGFKFRRASCGHNRGVKMTLN